MRSIYPSPQDSGDPEENSLLLHKASPTQGKWPRRGHSEGPSVCVLKGHLVSPQSPFWEAATAELQSP
jgi:hypothetical protein